MKLLDRLLLACIRWRLRSDVGNGFTGKLILCSAERIRQCCEDIEAEKVVESIVAQVVLRTAALDKFTKLEAGESARQ